MVPLLAPHEGFGCGGIVTDGADGRLHVLVPTHVVVWHSILLKFVPQRSSERHWQVIVLRRV